MKNGKMPLFVLIVVLVAFYAAFVYASRQARTPAATKQETTFERVMRTQTIRCGYAIWDPVLFKDLKTGEIKGISRDIMDEVAKKLELRIDWTEEAGWGNIVEGLATHRYDMICNALGIISARARAIDFSVPLFYAPTYLVVRKDEKRIQKNEDANNPDITVSILDGEAFSFLAPRKFPKAVIKSLPQMTDYSAVYQDVEAKKADATGVTYSDFVRYDRANPGKLKVVDKANPLLMYGASFGLPQGDVALKTMIDAALTELYFDGTIARVVKAYEFAPGEFLSPIKPYELPAPQKDASRK
ncbi:MAG: transporter substrate-binding domain-containing protein [Bdellovibrionales bacterium]